ncbi:MAG: tRNA guanosine(15) transglycosylase TgtA [DPANN group archaeon]|nr:tRNA guanosine(15) transglycosylase TgtA [DPANN group archaeon]
MLEIKYRDAAGRVCDWTFDKYKITTPNIAIVINPNKMIIPAKELKEKFGVEIIITNAYIIKKSKHANEIEKMGIHKFLDWDGPIYTDSGTFQMYSKGKVDITPDETIEYQKKIGSNIITPLDLFTLPEDKEDIVKSKLTETIERMKIAKTKITDSLFVGPIQGGAYMDLRILAAQETNKIKPDIFAIGGIVPLMEQYRYRDLVNTIINVRENLSLDRPLHAFGAGHPMMFSLLAAIGIDLFDSAAYALYAKGGRYMMPDGTRKLAEMEELPCTCPICATTKLKDFTLGDLTRHNLYVTMAEIRAIRQAMFEGRLLEFAEQRARSHPHLLDGFKEALKYKEYLEKFEPITKKSAFFVTGPESLEKPSVYRYKKRIKERYVAPKRKNGIIINTFKKNIISTTDTHFVLIKSPFGVVPAELTNLYPAGQTVALKNNYKIIETANKESIKDYVKSNKESYSKMTIIDNKYEEAWKKDAKDEEKDHFLEIRSVLMFQYGKKAINIFKNMDLEHEISLEISKKTKRIRRVLNKDKLLGTLRASDGLFIPSIYCAELIKNCLDYPDYRVVITDDAVPFVRDGKSVFSKFVKAADKNIRPYDEVFIVDSKDNLIATGKTLLNGQELLDFNHGLGVKTRESIKEQK